MLKRMLDALRGKEKGHTPMAPAQSKHVDVPTTKSAVPVSMLKATAKKRNPKKVKRLRKLAHDARKMTRLRAA